MKSIMKGNNCRLKIIFCCLWFCEMAPFQPLNSTGSAGNSLLEERVWRQRECPRNSVHHNFLVLLNPSLCFPLQHQRSWRLLEWPSRLLIWVDMNKVRKKWPKIDRDKRQQLAVPHYLLSGFIYGTTRGRDLLAVGLLGRKCCQFMLCCLKYF